MTLPALPFCRPTRRALLSSLLTAVGAATALALMPALCAAQDTPAQPLPKITVPPPKREFRGVWVASVENIDWPSKPGLSTNEQKAELIRFLDRSVALNLNAVLLQVRPSCDALYKSDLEPWSPYLTGQMGKAPEPYYDPLEFAVTEAHKRGLELHAWINPFRSRQSGAVDKYPASDNHISKTHPEWNRTYGKLQWLDPGIKEARDYSLAVIADIVKRYDVDGIHVDDYFYPYKETDRVTKKEIDFPDDTSYTAYQKRGGSLGKSDWRRSNIDDFIERMYEETKALKPWVKVGISPFGLWRPGNPYQIKGFDSYEQLAGDSRRWLHEGWADYFTPQLYWKIEQTPQSFPVLLNWWIGENVQNRHIWPGLYTSRASGRRAGWPQSEIEYQIKTTRGFSGSSGAIHFSAEWTLPDGPDSLGQHLLDTVYSEGAVLPESPWLAGRTDPLPAAAESVLAAPATSNGKKGWTVTWHPATPRTTPPAAQWVIQWRANGETWHQAIAQNSSALTAFIPEPSAPPPARTRGGSDEAAKPPPPAAVAVTPIDRVGRLGPAKVILLPKL